MLCLLTECSLTAQFVSAGSSVERLLPQLLVASVHLGIRSPQLALATRTIRTERRRNGDNTTTTRTQTRRAEGKGAEREGAERKGKKALPEVVVVDPVGLAHVALGPSTSARHLTAAVFLHKDLWLEVVESGGGGMREGLKGT